MGTGFSRSTPDDEKTSRAFYGVQQDIRSVAEFIRLYLTRNNRWISPKFLVGESYGTTRVSGLTWHLQQKYGIDLNGVVLLSPVLDFDTILFHPSHDLPYVLFLPTYAATVAYHQKSPDKEHGGVRKSLEDVESFCLEEYTVLLAKGDNLKTEEKERLTQKLHEYTGLSPNLLEENHFRINWMVFAKNLLRNERETVGRMDTTITGTEVNPADPYPAYDPSFDPLYGPFSTAINSYVRDELKLESDLPYEFLNLDVSRNWDWSSGLQRKQGFIDVSHTLGDAMSVNKHLKVFIASGIYDLATPYFAAKYTVSHMWMGEYRTNITIKNYRAGHMIVTHMEELKKLTQDVKDFYANSLRN
jgi:carboxypeptidase C (cathepsin A)